jgi:hypothetical protein
MMTRHRSSLPAHSMSGKTGKCPALFLNQVENLMPDEIIVPSDQVFIAGIRGETGEPISRNLQKLAGNIRGVSPEPGDEDADHQKLLKNASRSAEAGFSLPISVTNESDLQQTGWGIVFHQNESAAVKAALAPLIKHRRQQIGNSTRATLLEAEYFSDESHRQWLGRLGTAPGTIKPKKVPYYLLLVGSPELIPLEFGYLLDLEYCVGRLHFETAEEYERYARSVIDYETSQSTPGSKEAVFFGTRHALDPATNLSASQLVLPLMEGIADEGISPVTEDFGFRQRKLLGPNALKTRLQETLTPGAGQASPAFLFTATHGVEWKRDHPKQRRMQGALVCQEWKVGVQPEDKHLFAAADVTDLRVQGMISFHFACYGAGTPRFNRFEQQAEGSPEQLADKAFFAALPQALLSHPNGGALACIGHIERAWGCSIRTAAAGTQIQPFQNAIGHILKGDPVGFALKDFNLRHAVLSTELTQLLEQIQKFGKQVSDQQLVSLWTERNDAESYTLLGDPAVCLRVSDLH